MPKIYKDCVQCHHEFYVSEKDQHFFLTRELEIPKRCWSCRKNNRKECDEAREARSDVIASNPGVDPARIREDWDYKADNARRWSRDHLVGDTERLNNLVGEDASPPTKPVAGPNGGVVEFFTSTAVDQPSSENKRSKRRRNKGNKSS